MRHLRLSTLLAVLNVGLLLLAVTGVAIAAARLLQQLADEQALARTSQAAILARQQIDSEPAAMVTSAQLLSERPTLRRLLQERNTSELTTFLSQFQQTSHLDGAVVLDQGNIFAQASTTSTLGKPGHYLNIAGTLDPPAYSLRRTPARSTYRGRRYPWN